MPTLADLIRDLQDLPARIEKELGDAEYQTGIEVLQLAIRFSSGPYSQYDLAGMDHPYATRHGSPQLNPAIINVQTGRFRSSWRFTAGMWSSGELHTIVANFSPEAGFLSTGTRFMFARPVDDLVVLAVSNSRLKRIDQAVAKAMRPLTT